MRGTGAERPVRAMKSGKLDGAKGSRHPACPDGQPRAREESSSHAKPFNISKWVVWEAYTRVKANHGAAGVDAESIEMFEQDLKNNLYKIWNRMSSGTYFPASGPDGRHTEKGRKRAPLRHTHCRRQNCPNGGQDVPGTGRGAAVPPRFVWVSPTEVRDRRTHDSPAAMLAL